MELSLPSHYVAAGYPVQAKSWSDAFIRVRQVIAPLLGEQDQEVLLRDFERRDEQYVPQSISAESVVPPASPTVFAPRYSEEELVALTQKLLVERGALISTLTHIEAISGKVDQAHVEGIFLSENGKDVPYSLTFDPVNNVVRDIVRDGVRLPNAVPVDTFFR